MDMVSEVSATAAAPRVEPSPPPAYRDISVGSLTFRRIMLCTHILTEADDAAAVLRQYAKPHYQAGDVVFISETALAIMQGRARDFRSIKPTALARWLSGHVYKSPYGVGLRSPYAMEYAFELAGAHRILLGCAWHVVGRALRRKGWFYAAAGPQARMMDAEHTMGVKQFYECVIPGPADPRGTCRRLKEASGMDVAIVDVNDILPPWCVASTVSRLRNRLLELSLADNPLGQGDERTPLGIWRQV